MGGMIGSRNLTRTAGPSRRANGQKPSGHEVEKILPKVVSHVTFSAPKTIAPDRRYRSPPTVTATLKGSPSPEPPLSLFLDITSTFTDTGVSSGNGDPPPTPDRLGSSPPLSARTLSRQRSPRYPRSHGNIRATMDASQRTEVRGGRRESRSSLSVRVTNGGLPLQRRR